MIGQWCRWLFLTERRKRLLVAALLLVPLAILTLLFQEIARTLIVQPVMYLFWLAGLLWRSIPQEVLWAILVVVVLRVAVGSLVARRRRRETPRQEEEGGGRWGRTRTWARWIELAEQDGYYRRRLSLRLTDLTVDALAQREHLSRDLLEEELAAGRLDVPAPIRAFLLAVRNEPPPDRFARLKQLFLPRPAAPRITPQEILDYMEAQAGGGYGR